MLKSFGFLINSFNSSQNNITLCSNINEILTRDSKYSPIIFFAMPGASPVFTRCCQLHQRHAWGFASPLISTDIATTIILKGCLQTRRKLFYVYDLEWIYQPNIYYKILKDIYQNPEIDLIARSESHFDILKNCWKEPIGIVHDYDAKELTTLIDTL